jgi:hypothetical protein
LHQKEVALLCSVILVLIIMKIATVKPFVSSLLTGKWLGSRQIRCNWATKGANTGDEKQSSDSKSVVELTTGTSGAHDSAFGV